MHEMYCFLERERLDGWTIGGIGIGIVGEI